jgi:MarR family transcriptional regulator, negative regulator of the multidrug operon emrRAB
MAESDNNGIGPWLERLSALHRNLMRKFASEQGLPLVHVEILQYLSICNRYSDITQSISDYLGQTKGSISQSVGLLEEAGFIKRTQDRLDKRVFHLSLQAKGLTVTNRMLSSIQLGGVDKVAPQLRTLLTSIQKQNGLKGFGVCITCKFNQNPAIDSFVCGLTQETLTAVDVKKICKEHEPA